MGRYLVFARSEYAEPLRHQGDLEVPGGADPAALARARFGDGWVELVLVPESAIEWVMREAPVEARA